MTAACQSNMAAPTPDFSGVAFTTSADGFVVNLAQHAENDWPSFFIGCRSLGM
ncbi:hypothetical protein ACQZ6S_14115 [Agrobacterium tumefaciens]